MAEIDTAIIVAQGDDDALCAILEGVCALTGMGFAAIARVTEERWIAAQVVDKIEFGLKPGDELAIKTTICDDIRATCRAIVIDDASDSLEWRTHPTPILYGFKSYVSFPLILADGSFYGTLCAIDPAARTVSAAGTVAILEGYAQRLAEILSAGVGSSAASG